MSFAICNQETIMQITAALEFVERVAYCAWSQVLAGGETCRGYLTVHSNDDARMIFAIAFGRIYGTPQTSDLLLCIKNAEQLHRSLTLWTRYSIDQPPHSSSAVSGRDFIISAAGPGPPLIYQAMSLVIAVRLYQLSSAQAAAIALHSSNYYYRRLSKAVNRHAVA